MNMEIKEMIRKSGFHQWQVAQAIGITAGTLTVWLRDDPMPENRKQRIISALEKLSCTL